MEKFRPTFRLKQLPRAKILARLGYSPGRTRLGEQDEVLIQKIFSESRRFIQPRFAYVSGQINILSPTEVLLDNLRVVSRDIVKLLEKCFLVYGLAITIGQQLENWRDYLKNNNRIREAVIVDAIGSEVVEEFAEDFNQQLTTFLAGDNYRTTRRFSCGYGDWNLSGQKDFVNWVGAASIGIKVTPAFQLVPEKSITALIGVYNEKK